MPGNPASYALPPMTGPRHAFEFGDLLAIWVGADALLLLLLSQAEFIDRDNGVDLRARLCLALLSAQLAVSALWFALGSGRWTGRALLLAIFLLWQSLLVRAVLNVGVIGKDYPVWFHALTITELLMEGTTFCLIALALRVLGLRIGSGQDRTQSNAVQFRIVDLFLLTTAVALILFAFDIPELWQLGMRFQHHEYLAFRKWLRFPFALLVLCGAASRHWPFSNVWWIGAPLFALAAWLKLWYRGPLDQFMWIMLYLSIFPVTMLLSLDYLRLRGFRVQWHFPRYRRSVPS